MKRPLLILLACVCLAPGCISVHAGAGKVSYSSVPVGALRHVVLFKFNDDVSPAKQHEVVEASRDLADRIDEVRAFEWGTEMSRRGMAQGFTHAAVFVFDNEAERDAYLEHPVHQDFVAMIRPLMREIFVFDYWVQH